MTSLGKTARKQHAPYPPLHYIDAVETAAATYHNHKEQMAYATFAVQSGVFGFVIVSDAWPPAWLPAWVAALWLLCATGLMHCVLVNHIFYKQIAAFRVAYASALRQRQFTGSIAISSEPARKLIKAAWWRRYLFPRVSPKYAHESAIVVDGTRKVAAAIELEDCRALMDVALPTASLFIFIGSLFVTFAKTVLQTRPDEPIIQILVRLTSP